MSETKKRRAWTCEVFIPRTGEWTEWDVCNPIVGQRQLSMKAYERALLRQYPILKNRDFRIGVKWVVPSRSRPAHALNDAFAGSNAPSERVTGEDDQ